MQSSVLERQAAINYMRLTVRLGYGRLIILTYFPGFVLTFSTVPRHSFLFFLHVCLRRKLRPQGFSQTLWALSCSAYVGLHETKCPGLNWQLLYSSAAHEGDLEGCELLLHFTVEKLMNVPVCPHMCC